MSTVVVILASAALVYFVGLPLVELVHEGKEIEKED